MVRQLLDTITIIDEYKKLQDIRLNLVNKLQK